MKRTATIFFMLVCSLLLMSFASASWFGDIFNKFEITGNTVASNAFCSSLNSTLLTGRTCPVNYTKTYGFSSSSCCKKNTPYSLVCQKAIRYMISYSNYTCNASDCGNDKYISCQQKTSRGFNFRFMSKQYAEVCEKKTLQDTSCSVKPSCPAGYFIVNKTICSDSSNNCKVGKGERILNGNYTKKITFVFIPDNYSNISLWKYDINNFTNYLFTLEPFNSYKNRFDIWRIDDLNHSYTQGDYLSGTNLFDNERDLAVNISQDCIGKPQDLLIIIKDNSLNPSNTFGFSSAMDPYFNAISRLQGPVGESSLGVNTLTHEVGHGFGKLGDEYIGSYLGSRSTYIPNVDVKGCPKWCSGTLNTTSACFERYLLFEECLKNVTNNFTLSYSEFQGAYQAQCQQFDTHYRIGLGDCDLGTNCKNNTGCYWGTTSLQEFRSSLNSIMRYGNQFDGINFEVIKEKIENLTL